MAGDRLGVAGIAGNLLGVTGIAGDRLGVAGIAGALAVGVALRSWNLDAQVLSGDEYHAILAALVRPVPDILFRYQAADNCIPLTVLDRLLLDGGVALSERLVRLPVMLCGLALLVLAPLWAWRRLGRGSAVALAWLVAISPGLVFYSRIARSYAPATLCGCAAVAAFAAWHQQGGGGTRAAAYVGCALLAVWFHLGAAPLALSPFAAAAVLALARRGGPPLSRLALLAAATAAGLAALLVPAHRTLLPLVESKHARLDVSRAEAAEVGAWMAGTRGGWAAAAVGAAALGGAALLLWRDARLGAFVLAAPAVQLAGILWLAPFGHQATIVLARYLVFALPLAVVPLAVVLGAPLGALGGAPIRRRAVQPWLAAVAVAALFAGGPFLDTDLARSSFAHDELYLRFTARRPPLDAGAAPLAVYRWLASAAPGAVIELPWDPMIPFDRILGLYQTLHGRDVVVAARGAAGDLGWRNCVGDQPRALLASRGRWLIVHRTMVREQLRLGGNPWAPTRDLRWEFRGRARAVTATLLARWGPPDYHDEWTTAWDLARVRAAAARCAACGDAG